MTSYDYSFLSSPTLSTYQNVAPASSPNMMSTGYQSPFAQTVNSYSYGNKPSTGQMVSSYLMNQFQQPKQQAYQNYGGGDLLSNPAYGLIGGSGVQLSHGGGLWSL